MVEKSIETILIVEDDAGVATLERRRLERAGYATVTAATADEALQKLSRTKVDLILLDFRLPGDVDGLDFFARVKAAGYDLPVILVTGFSNEAVVIKALRAGVRDFITKSIEYLDYLPEAVGHVLRQVGTEHRLAESEGRLAAVIESAKDAIIIAEADQRISLFNHAAERMFHCPAAGAIGERLSRFIPRDFTPLGGEEERRGEAVESLTHHVRAGSRGVRADGEEFPLEASVSRGEADARKFYTIMVRDVTERTLLEQQLRQAQKMEVVGQLAGGVAHDFNNLLTVINGYSDILVGSLRQGDPLRDLVEQIKNAGDRAALLTRQLLAFSRKQLLVPKVLDLNALLVEIEKMLGRLIGEDIDLALHPHAGLWPVKADTGQVEQIIMNLVVNARDAMAQGGKVTIETDNAVLDETYASDHVKVQVGEYVRLAVSDTGCGMDAATKARIFEPFFTTKGPEKGTGLGLATVHGIVKQSGGHIDVYSELNVGTTFKIYLPRVKEPLAASVAHPAGARPPIGTETVLVVEDEDMVRKLALFVLQKNGYKVLEARHGGEALLLCEQFQGPIQLMVTDVIMPNMSGPQLAKRLAVLRPEMKVLYLSGYTDDAIVHHGMLAPDIHFLQKPYSTDALARKVRELLDQ